jgi:hypothetical protein
VAYTKTEQHSAGTLRGLAVDLFSPLIALGELGLIDMKIIITSPLNRAARDTTLTAQLKNIENRLRKGDKT